MHEIQQITSRRYAPVGRSAHGPLSPLSTSLPRWLRALVDQLIAYAQPGESWAAEIKELHLDDTLRTILSNDAVGRALARLAPDGKTSDRSELRNSIKEFLFASCLVYTVAKRIKASESFATRRKRARAISKSARRLARDIKNNRRQLPSFDRVPYLSWIFLRTLPINGSSASATTSKSAAEVPPGVLQSMGASIADLMRIYADQLDAWALLSHARARTTGKDAERNRLTDQLGYLAKRQFGHLPASLVAGMVSSLTGVNIDESTVRKRPAFRK